jgi:hypothetical protein
MPSIDPTHQLVILARLNDFCQFHGTMLHYEKDPWGYMLRKIAEVEAPLTGLKTALFTATRTKLLEELKAPMTEERHIDFKSLFERLLAPGDFADLAIHLTNQGGGDPKLKLQAVSQILGQVQVHTGFVEERKPAGQRSPSWEKLIKELHTRLDLDRMDAVLKRKPKTARRRAYVLRRVRRNVAEYCTVLRIPTDPKDTFTPFMLPRIEALAAACWRFLYKHHR